MDDRFISPEDDPTTDVAAHGMNLGNDNETVIVDEPEIDETPPAAVRPMDSREPDVAGHRLAANDDEIVVDESPDVEGHRLAANDDEVVVDDTRDVEGHRLASNDDEIVVED
jgi:hypothetical protein